MAEPRVVEPDVHVTTACPLDCPDGCSLSVGVRDGRIVEIDGGHANDVTRGYICAKVRRFPERVYGPDRLRYPMARTARGRNWPHNGRRCGYCGPATTPAV